MKSIILDIFRLRYIASPVTFLKMNVYAVNSINISFRCLLARIDLFYDEFDIHVCQKCKTPELERAIVLLSSTPRFALAGSVLSIAEACGADIGHLVEVATAFLSR